MGRGYDVIVVGGGPAGASTAYTLVRAGHRTLLLEKKSLPREKPCAGAVPKAALAGFDFSCEETFVESAHAVGCSFQKDVPRFQPVPVETIALVDRARFDAHLLAHCGATSAIAAA